MILCKSQINSLKIKGKEMNPKYMVAVVIVGVIILAVWYFGYKKKK